MSVPARKLTSEQRRELVTRGGNLATLSQHPSWADLTDEVGRKEERLRKLVLTKALALTTPVDQRELDFIRGFIAGMRWLIAVPSGAESRLESYLKKHGVNLQDEGGME